jgi:hypothetical protein
VVAIAMMVIETINTESIFALYTWLSIYSNCTSQENVLCNWYVMTIKQRDHFDVYTLYNLKVINFVGTNV